MKNFELFYEGGFFRLFGKHREVFMFLEEKEEEEFDTIWVWYVS